MIWRVNQQYQKGEITYDNIIIHHYGDEHVMTD